MFCCAGGRAVSALFGRGTFCCAGGCGTVAVLGCGVTCPCGGRGTLLGCAGLLFAVLGRSTLLFAAGGRAALALFARLPLASDGRVAGTFTGAFLAATT